VPKRPLKVLKKPKRTRKKKPKRTRKRRLNALDSSSSSSSEEALPAFVVGQHVQALYNGVWFDVKIVAPNANDYVVTERKSDSRMVWSVTKSEMKADTVDTTMEERSNFEDELPPGVTHATLKMKSSRDVVSISSESDADTNSGTESVGDAVGSNRSGKSGCGDDGNSQPDDNEFADTDNFDDDLGFGKRKQALHTKNVWVDPIELGRSCGCPGPITTSSWLEYLLSDEMEGRFKYATHFLHWKLGMKGGGGPLALIAQKEAKLRERCALLASGKAWKMRMKKHSSVYSNCAPSDFTLRMLLQKWLLKIGESEMDLRGFWSDWGMIRLYNTLVTRVLNETRETADIQTSDEEAWASEQDLHVVNDGEGEHAEGEGVHPSFYLKELQRQNDARHEADEVYAMTQRVKERATASCSGSDLSDDSNTESSCQEEVYDDLDRAEQKLRLKKRSNGKKRKSASKRRSPTSKRTRNPLKGKGKLLLGSESSSSSSDSDTGPKTKDKKGTCDSPAVASVGQRMEKQTVPSTPPCSSRQKWHTPSANSKIDKLRPLDQDEFAAEYDGLDPEILSGLPLDDGVSAKSKCHKEIITGKVCGLPSPLCRTCGKSMEKGVSTSEEYYYHCSKCRNFMRPDKAKNHVPSGVFFSPSLYPPPPPPPQIVLRSEGVLFCSQGPTAIAGSHHTLSTLARRKTPHTCVQNQTALQIERRVSSKYRYLQ
jgi:hypothetical protein